MQSEEMSHSPRQSVPRLIDKLLFRCAQSRLLLGCLLHLGVIVAIAVLSPRIAFASVWDESSVFDVGADGVVTVQCSRTRSYATGDVSSEMISWALPVSAEGQGSESIESVEFGELRDDGSLRRYDLVMDHGLTAEGTFKLEQDGSLVSISAKLAHGDGDTTYCVKYQLKGAVRRWADVAEVGIMYQGDWFPLHSQISVFLPGAEGEGSEGGQGKSSAWIEWEEDEGIVGISVADSDASSDSHLEEDHKSEFELYHTSVSNDGQEAGYVLRATAPAEAFPAVEVVGEERESAILSRRDELAREYEEYNEGLSERHAQAVEALKAAKHRSSIVLVAALWILAVVIGALTVVAAERAKRAYKRGNPVSPGVELLDDGVDPLVVACLRGGGLTYGGIAASIAGLASKGLLQSQTVEVQLSKGRRKTCSSTLVHTTEVSADSLCDECEKLVMSFFTEGLCEISCGREKERTIDRELPAGSRYVLFADFDRLAPIDKRRTYFKVSRSLPDSLDSFCREKGYYGVDEKSELKFLSRMKSACIVGAVITCISFMTSPFAFGLEDESALISLVVPMIGLCVVYLYSGLLVRVFKKTPTTPEAQQMSNHIASFAFWVDKLPANAYMLPDEDERITQALLYALALGRGRKLAECVRRERPTSLKDDAVATTLTWCEGTAEELVDALKHFEDLYRVEM